VIFAREKQELRYLLRVPVRCRILDDDGPETELITETVNISAGGFFIRISERIKVGTELALYLKLPTDMSNNPFCELPCRGKVAWEQAFLDGSYGYDVEIEEAGAALPSRVGNNHRVIPIRH
jgi:hypothetical protein